jgi:hypothetical protein
MGNDETSAEMYEPEGLCPPPLLGIQDLCQWRNPFRTELQPDRPDVNGVLMQGRVIGRSVPGLTWGLAGHGLPRTPEAAFAAR